MQATFTHAGVAGDSKILVQHKNETLEFSGAVYQQSFKKGNYEPFQQINRWWKRLEPKEQDEVFDLYLQAKNVLNETFDVHPLILQLRPIIHRLLELHDTPEFDRWARYHASIWIPEELDVEYKYTHEKPSSREQTYLVSDYWELVFMVMKLRTLAPIWGSFAENTRTASGQSFRDLNTYFLISKSRLVEGEAMIRLNNYIAKNVKQDDINIRSSIDGIGSEAFQTNLLANILVRFLIVASLTREPSDTHIVQVVHKTLRNRLSQNESHQNTILEKTNPNEDDSSEDSSSRAEKYKNKPLVAPGEFTAIETWTEYVYNVASRLMVKDKLDDSEIAGLDLALKSSDSLEGFVLEECQIHLIRWVLSPIVTARAMWDINRESSLRCAGIAQFVLWNTGFKDLAGFTTARSLNGDGYSSFGQESRAHIPKDLIEELNTLYPFYRRHPTKKTPKAMNEVVAEIHDLSGKLAEHTWFLNMQDDLIAELRGSAANKTYRVGYDIRIRLANYAIYRQKRNKEYLSLLQFEN